MYLKWFYKFKYWCIIPLFRLSSSAFNSVRLWTVVALCVLRLLLTRYHLQAYLNLAQKWVEQMKKEAGRIAAIDIQRKVGLKCEATLFLVYETWRIKEWKLLFFTINSLSWSNKCINCFQTRLCRWLESSATWLWSPSNTLYPFCLCFSQLWLSNL